LLDTGGRRVNEVWSSVSDSEVPKPVARKNDGGSAIRRAEMKRRRRNSRGSGHGHGLGSDSEREDFPSDYPSDRTPGCSKERDVDADLAREQVERKEFSDASNDEEEEEKEPRLTKAMRTRWAGRLMAPVAST